LEKAKKKEYIHHPLEPGLITLSVSRVLEGKVGELTKVPIMTILTGRPFHKPLKPMSL
jgi:hypothetical protein